MKQTQAGQFKSTFRNVDDVSSIKNSSLHSYVDLIYPCELDIIEDTTESGTSVVIFEYHTVLENKMTASSSTSELCERRN